MEVLGSANMTNSPILNRPHYMIREILEEPRVIRETLTQELSNVREIADKIISEAFELVYVVGSGTSYHAGLASQYALSNLTSLMVSSIPASEFSEWIPSRIPRKSLMIAISQSGESSDIINATRVASERGMTILAITNTPESTLARISDYSIHPRSGKEVAVPATKSYIAQLTAIFMLSLEIGKFGMDPRNLIRLRKGLYCMAEFVDEAIKSLEDLVREAAETYADKGLFFLLGSGPNYATALEGALKLKETCNVFAEGFAIREFLHGPIRLVDERTPIIAMVSPDEMGFSLNILRNLRSFDAPILTICESEAELREVADFIFRVPFGLPKIFSPILYVIPIQIFTYYNSIFRGLNPDKPEKLRKVVR